MNPRSNDPAVLRWLRRQGPMTVNDLCDALPIPSNSVGQVLRRLERRGLAHRVGKYQNGRGRLADVWAAISEAA